MTQNKTVTVHILDKEYCIACPDDERDNLESAARYLDGKMREIRSSGKVIGSDRIAVMAGLNITHELLHKHEQQEKQVNVAREQVRDLLDRVNDALTSDSAPDLFSPLKS
jgi:cell division protein ZapA